MRSRNGFRIILLLIAGLAVYLALASGVSWSTILIVGVVVFISWSVTGSLAGRYYRKNRDLDSAYMHDIPAWLWIMTLGGVMFPWTEGGDGPGHHAPEVSDWSGGDVGQSDGGGWGGGDNFN